jgi:hypothetical protein
MTSHPLVQLIEALNLTSISRETMDGMDYYKLDFSPNNHYIRRSLIMEATGALSLARTDLPKELLNIAGQVNSTLLLSSGNVVLDCLGGKRKWHP